MAGQSVSGFNELATSTNSSDPTKRPGTPQITPSELSRPVNLQRIAQRKAQIKTYPIRKKLEKLGVYSSCKASIWRINLLVHMTVAPVELLILQGFCERVSFVFNVIL